MKYVYTPTSPERQAKINAYWAKRSKQIDADYIERTLLRDKKHGYPSVGALQVRVLRKMANGSRLNGFERRVRIPTEIKPCVYGLIKT